MHYSICLTSVIESKGFQISMYCTLASSEHECAPQKHGKSYPMSNKIITTCSRMQRSLSKNFTAHQLTIIVTQTWNWMWRFIFFQFLWKWFFSYHDPPKRLEINFVGLTSSTTGFFDFAIQYDVLPLIGILEFVLIHQVKHVSVFVGHLSTPHSHHPHLNHGKFYHQAFIKSVISIPPTTSPILWPPIKIEVSESVFIPAHHSENFPVPGFISSAFLLLRFTLRVFRTRNAASVYSHFGFDLFKCSKWSHNS